MAQQRNPNDPSYEDQAVNRVRGPARLDQELQADPEVAEGRISGGRIAAAVLAILVLVGGVYYGMNMSSKSPTSTATQTTPANPSASPAVRDVTPNRDAGATTGSAPASPQSPASPPSNSSTNPSR